MRSKQLAKLGFNESTEESKYPGALLALVTENACITRPPIKPIRSTRKLMVAHSDHYLLEHIVLGLEQSGFSVINANSGITCVRKMGLFTPDVLLLDTDLLWGGGAMY